MSLDIYPRRAIPDRVLLISRRTHELRMGMVPRIGVALIQMFILFRVALETGMRLHAFAFLPNQYQLVISEPRNHSRVSEFIERLNRYLARVFNARNRTRGYFWDSEPTHIVELLDPESALDAMVYTLTNPQKAGLAVAPGRWLGLESSVDAIGAPATPVAKPPGMASYLPDSLDFVLVKPAFFDHMDDADFRELLAKRVRAASLKIRRERRQKGLRTLSNAEILETHHRDTPRETEADEEERKADRTRSLFRGAPALCREAELTLQGFHDAYRTAWERWSDGDHDVLFPPGTDKLRRVHGACCVQLT